MRVLVTRPEPDAATFATRCQEAGLAAVAAPLMSVVFKTAEIDIAEISAFAFTSANGVRALSAASDRRDLPVFAIGAATGESAKAAGFTNIFVADGDIQSLTSLVDQNRTKVAGIILHVAGAHRAGDLVSGLKRLGLEARREVLYEARAADHLPEAARAALQAEPPIEWVSFFSPRTAALFLALVDDAGMRDRLQPVRAACLSQAVADALSGAAWKSVEIAPHRDADGIISVMTR